MRTMKHWALAASAAAALALAGCGGGGGGSGPSAPSARSDVTLPAGTPAANHPAAGTYQIAAGGTLELNGVVYSCAGSDCTLYVGPDGSMNSSGGMLTAAHSATLAALLQAQADLAAAQAALATANQDLMAKQAALDAANADLTSTQADLATARADLAAAQTALDTANADLMTAQAALDAANADLTAKQAELDMANADLAAKQTELDTANAVLTERQAALDAAQQRVDDLISSGTATAAELAEANANLATAQGNLMDAQGDVTRLEGELAAANAEVDRITPLLAAANAEVDRITPLLAAAQAEVDRLTPLLDAANAEVDRITPLLAAAQAEVDRLTPLLAAANTEIERLQGLLDTARQTPQRAAITAAIEALNAALADVDASATDAEVKAADDALATAMQAIDDATYLPADEVADRTADVNGIAGNLATAKAMRTTSIAAATKEAAIEAEAAQGADGSPSATLHADAGLGGTNTADGTAVTTYTMTIERPRSGTEIKIVDSALNGDDDPKFMQAMDLGGGTTMHTRMMEADDDGNVMTEVVVVTTDIEAPKATKFAEVMGQTLNVDLDTTTDADNDGTADNDLTALAVGADINTAPVADDPVLGLVKSAAFAAGSGDSVLHTFARYQLDSDTTTDGNQTVEAFTAPGTYNGAMGTYRCSSTTADCTVTVDDEGAITAMSAGWAFIPATGATSDVADADYLHYGFWLKRTTDDDGVLTYNEVETFAGSSIAQTADVSSVRGTASYEGGATGVYVHTVDNPDGTRNRATSGHFTADASLTATFGQTTAADPGGADQIAPNMLNTITGIIDSFVLSGGESNAWEVTLNRGAIVAAPGAASGTTTGGGSYSATFHGPVGDHDSDAATPEIPYPGSVVGEFDAVFSNGSVAGAFGARETD